MKQPIRLKPCPFCGSKDVLLATEKMLPSGSNRYYAECPLCLMRGPVTSTRKYAIVKWNDRSCEDV